MQNLFIFSGRKGSGVGGKVSEFKNFPTGVGKLFQDPKAKESMKVTTKVVKKSGEVSGT